MTGPSIFKEDPNVEDTKTVTVKLTPPYHRFLYDGIRITGDETKEVPLAVYEANANKLTLVDVTGAQEGTNHEPEPKTSNRSRSGKKELS